MKVNITKTKTMHIAKVEKEHVIHIDGIEIEQKHNFRYLRAVVSQTGGVEEEINSRESSAGKLFNAIKTGFLKKKEVSKKAKLSVFKSTYIPTLTYS